VLKDYLSIKVVTYNEISMCVYTVSYILEKEKNHVSEENLDVSMASDAVYLEIPWSRGRTIF